MTGQQLDVVKVELHHRISNIWHVVLRRRPGAHRSIDLYLTSTECREIGIDLPPGTPR